MVNKLVFFTPPHFHFKYHRLIVLHLSTRKSADREQHLRRPDDGERARFPSSQPIQFSAARAGARSPDAPSTPPPFLPP